MPNRLTIISALFLACLIWTQLACEPGQSSIEEIEPACGDNRVDVNETCDGNCPESCEDGIACTHDSMEGSPDTCDAVCSHEPQTRCDDNDGCCPAGCDARNDSDCSPTCGDGKLDPGETCDGDCPTQCNDGNACTLDALAGDPGTCSAACSFTLVSQCQPGDGCCPAGCDTLSDSDCSASCGNGVLEVGETCDGDCPLDCEDDDVCTLGLMSGSLDNCSLACTQQAISQCADGDGCCPAGCNTFLDADCESVCGNAIVEQGETCDPPSACLVDLEECDDSDPCIRYTRTGRADLCTAQCHTVPIVDFVDKDGCCPDGGDFWHDADCNPCPMGAYPCEEGCCEWQIRNVHQGNFDAWSQQMRIDNSGRLNLVFNTGDLAFRFAQEREDGFYLLDGPARDSGALHQNFAFDSYSKPHVVFYDSIADQLVYAWNIGQQWIQEIVYAGQMSFWQGHALAITVDQDNWPIIAFRDSGARSLKLATRDENGWTVETLDDRDYAGREVELAVDEQGRLHAAYIDDMNDIGIYAIRNGQTWDRHELPMGGAAHGINLRLDNAGQAFVTWSDEDRAIHLATWDGSRWHMQIVTTGQTYLSRHLGLALDDAGNPHLAFVCQESGYIVYARQSDGHWSFVELDSGATHLPPSIVIDHQGHPAISWRNEETFTLHVATF